MFAAEILMDDDEVLALLKSGCDYFSCAKMLYMDENLLSIKLAGMNNRSYSVSIPVSYNVNYWKYLLV